MNLIKFINMEDNNSRRKFLQQIGATSLLAASTPFSSFATSIKAEERILFYDKKISSNDKIRIGVIGYGVQGPGQAGDDPGRAAHSADRRAEPADVPVRRRAADGAHPGAAAGNRP